MSFPDVWWLSILLLFLKNKRFLIPDFWLPGYSRGVPDFATYSLVLVVFGAVDLPRTSSMLVHFLETQFEMIVGLYVWHNEEHLFHCLGYISTYVFTYTLMIHNIIIPSYYLLHFHVQNSALFWKSNLILSLYIDVVLTLSMSMSFVLCYGCVNIMGSQIYTYT